MSQRLLNRELSWLAFNRRVLSLAEEVGIPLLERLKFCAICSSNLDEFFQVRVAALKDQVAAGVTQPAYDGSSPQAQLTEIATTADRFVVDQERVLDHLLSELAQHGVELVDWSSLDAEDHRPLIEGFEQRMFPVLTPHRDAFQAHCAAHGVETLIHYPVPIPRQPALVTTSPAMCPIADRVCAEVVSLPMYPALSPAQLDAVTQVFSSFVPHGH